MNMVKKIEVEDAMLPDSHALLLRLAKLLHQYGTPAHRLEQAIENIAKGLGLSVEIFSMPTGLLLGFQDENGQNTHILRVSNGELHLEKQSDIDELADRLVQGELSLTEASLGLKKIKDKPERYARWMVILAFGLCGISISFVLGGAWLELLFSFVGGLVTGAIAVASESSEHWGRLVPAISSFVTAFLMTLFAFFFGSFAQTACHLSSVIILVPGLSVTIAMTELSTMHLVSGTARLAGAFGVLLQLGFGLALGQMLGHRLFGVVLDLPSGHFGVWSFWLSMLLAGLSFLVLFRARPNDFIWLVIAGVLAMLGSKLGVEIVGARLGPFLGAFSVGLASHLFARVFRRPASIMMIPGIIMLVPGSVGLSSVSELMKQHTLVGMEAAFTMFMVAVSLVFGVLLAALVLPPRRSL